MAWSWSHTPEAYENARNNLAAQPREWLNEVLAEWKNRRLLNAGNLSRWEKCLAYAASLPSDDIVADAIWERMEEQATCDNGGFNAWSCPFGCSKHHVSFDCTEEV